jgi:hypothetical protein
MKSILAGAALALSAALAAGPSQATTITDPAGDFLATYTGPQDGDMDVLSVTASIMGTNLMLSAVLNGAIGTTANSEYVFGVNTGGAGAPFTPFETGVLFNSVIVLNPDATGVVVNDIASPTITPLAMGAVTVSGDTISGIIPLSLLPSTGLTPGQYGLNLWPRLVGMDFAQISDFAPDNSTFAAVPEPSNWALMILGVGAMGAVLRSNRRRMLPANG